MKVQTRVSRGIRRWECPICQWRATVSTTRQHLQTGQPLTKEEQVSHLAELAERHFVANHRHAFSGLPHGLRRVK